MTNGNDINNLRSLSKMKKLAIFLGVIILILFGILIFMPPKSIAPDQKQKFFNIVVNSPQKGSIDYPLILKGKARVFENVVSYRLTDSQNNILSEGFVMANAPDTGQFGDFNKKIYYKETTAKEAILKVFQISAKDGSEIDAVEIPIKIPAFDGPNLKIYFGNKNKDPDTLKCEQTYAVLRKIPQKVSTVDAALALLIEGPTQNEKKEGYFSSLPDNVNIKLVALDEKTGKLIVDFDDSLMAGVGGSCRVASMKSQILNTLKQFDNVKEAIITINGRAEGVFEP